MIADRNDAIRLFRRESTDRLYMIHALVSLLGPKALQVWRQWQGKSVQRIHHDWGPEAHNLDGEGRAQVLLDFEAASVNSTSIEDADAHIESIRGSADKQGDEL